LLNEVDLNSIPLLIFANKQDLSKACSVSEVVEKLNLNKIKNREWYCQGCSSLNGKGVDEGIDWLVKTLINKDNLN